MLVPALGLRVFEKLVEELKLDGAKSCVTPGLKALPEQHEADMPLSPEHTTMSWALASRANHLIADRPDFQYVAKEICR